MVYCGAGLVGWCFTGYMVFIWLFNLKPRSEIELDYKRKHGTQGRPLIAVHGLKGYARTTMWTLCYCLYLIGGPTREGGATRRSRANLG